MSITIPGELERNVLETWADRGRRWLDDLPCLIDEVAGDWQLEVGEPFQLSFHWVTAVTRSDGSPAVLKLGVVGGGHLADQAEALAAYGGDGAVRLLDQDVARGAMLLERALPGSPAATLVPHRDGEATAALIDVGRRLHRTPPPGCTLPHLREESESFRTHLQRFPGYDPLPRGLVERAGALFDELCADAASEVLLHGDLHHDNVLRSERLPWLAIDPSGVVGDPGYDCGTMLYNPEPWRREDDLLALVPARIEQLADGFGIAVERVVAWGFVMGALSEVWTAQGGTPGGRALDVARLLQARLS